MSEMRSAQLREQRFPHLHCPGWVKLSGHVGADFQNDSILQIAVIVTDGDIEVIKEGPEITIHHPEEVRQQLVHDSSAACVARLSSQPQRLTMLREGAAVGCRCLRP